ncbi:MULTISPECIES: hypothetical protein [Streptomyces]|uniref:non-homologous end-joining DNA ligase LigD n=1 Tax=Streptomyces TaxID=1883 RepID=UPI0027E563A2|nr:MULTISPECIES: hypothetical protein [unclassified Streptomyces]
MSAEERLRVGRRTVVVTRPDKVLFPADGITKSDLADYYRLAADAMVPQLRPEGIEGQSFMRKDVPDHFPDWFHRVELPKADGTVTYAVGDEPAALVYLAGQACITPHRFVSRADRPHHPGRMVFDLDPADDDFGASARQP